MKRFLLMGGSHYYPESYTGDWIGTFETYEEARNQVYHKTEEELFTRGPRKGQVKETHARTYIIRSGGDKEVDWWNIEDLEHWMD